MDKLADAAGRAIDNVTNVIPDGDKSNSGEMVFLGRSEALTAHMINTIQDQCGVCFAKPAKELASVEPPNVEPAKPAFSFENMLDELDLSKSG